MKPRQLNQSINTRADRRVCFLNRKVVAHAMVLAGLLSTSHLQALEIESSRLIQTASHTELMLRFDEEVPASLKPYRLNEPMRQIVDLGGLLKGESLKLPKSQKGLLPGLQLVNEGGRSLIQFELAGDEPVHVSRSGRVLLVRVGGKPMVEGTETLVAAPHENDGALASGMPAAPIPANWLAQQASLPTTPVLSEVLIQEQDDRTLVLLKSVTGMPIEAVLSRIDNPPRQIADFNASLEPGFVPPKPSPDGRIKDLTLVEGDGKVRLVLTLKDQYAVEQQASAEGVTLAVRGPKPLSPDSGSVLTRLPARGSLEVAREQGLKMTQPTAVVLMSARHELDDTGAELITMEFDQPVSAKATRKDNVLRLQIQSGRLTEAARLELSRLQGVLFQKPTVSPGDQNLVLTVPLRQSDYLLKQTGSQLQIVLNREYAGPSDFKPGGVRVNFGVPETNQSNTARPQFTGRPISLDFKNADIQTVMQVFADFTGMNLVLTDGVAGQVTVYLKDVPWDQALDVVMKSKGLVARNSGKILMVSTAAEAKESKESNSGTDIVDELEPLVSRSFSISYFKTNELMEIIRDEESKLLSSRGTVISDERTGQMFIEDTPRRVERLAALIQQLDKPVPQVLIEARVVLADTKVAEDISAALVAGQISAIPDTTTIIGDVVEDLGSDEFIDSRRSSAINGAYTLLTSSGTRFLNFQLRAMESDSRVRTVSNPRVITSNKEEALIEQGTEIPYRVATSSGATSIEFREANLKLQVTPQIAPDGSIMLDVDISKDSVGQETQSGLAINTRHVKTKVSVMNGGTVVLGGIFEESTTDAVSKVPILGDIPIMGRLFRSDLDSKDEAELLIFLTPVILGET